MEFVAGTDEKAEHEALTLNTGLPDVATNTWPPHCSPLIKEPVNAHGFH